MLSYYWMKILVPLNFKYIDDPDDTNIAFYINLATKNLSDNDICNLNHLQKIVNSDINYEYQINEKSK